MDTSGTFQRPIKMLHLQSVLKQDAHRDVLGICTAWAGRMTPLFKAAFLYAQDSAAPPSTAEPPENCQESCSESPSTQSTGATGCLQPHCHPLAATGSIIPCSFLHLQSEGFHGAKSQTGKIF